LSSSDPCDALALIDSQVATQATSAYNDLADTVATGRAQIEAADAEIGLTALEERSTEQFIAQRAEEIDASELALDDLESRYDEALQSLQPLAVAAREGQQTAVFVTDATNGLTALSVSIERASNLPDVADTSVTWRQVSTGTWSTSVVEVAGTTEQSDTETGFEGVEDDPLGLAIVMLANSGRLVDILNSAPSETGDTVEWTVPPDVIGDGQRWQARAVIEDGTLVRLTLTSEFSTIVFTPSR